MSPADERTVSGEVVWSDPPSQRKATVRVLVEDVSFADASSIVIAQQVLRDVDLDPSGHIPFSLSVPETDPRHDYVVRAHVDMTGDGEIAVGDLVSTQSHPVLTRGQGTRVVVPVIRVT